MNYFFGFEILLQREISWSGNFNQVLLFIGGSLLVLLALVTLSVKSPKIIKRTKITMAATLLVLELGRFTFRMFENIYLGNDLGLTEVMLAWNFVMCAVNVWVTIVTLILSIYISSNNKALIILKNILLGSGLTGGFLMFLHPMNITPYRSIVHFVNAQTIMAHLLLIIVPLYLIKAKELEVRFKNLWMASLGFMGGATIFVTASHISGHNFTFALGINFPFVEYWLLPWHLLLMGGILFLIPTILYAMFEMNYRKHNELEVSDKMTPKEIKYNAILIAGGVIVVACILFLPILLGADRTFNDITRDFDNRALNSWVSLIILIPFTLYMLLHMFICKLKGKEQTT